jgi:hypothetical protein
MWHTILKKIDGIVLWRYASERYTVKQCCTIKKKHFLAKNELLFEYFSCLLSLFITVFFHDLFKRDIFLDLLVNKQPK